MMKNHSMNPTPKTSKERRKKKSYTTHSYAAEMSVLEGTELMQHVLTNLRGDEKLKVNGFITKRDFARFEVLTTCELTCFKCGVKATHFIADKHRNDHVMPYSLNLYAGKKMLTWDHIVPKSLGGGNDPLNGRCACSNCNENRGSDMTLSEMIWAATQNPLKIYKEPTKDYSKIRDYINVTRREYLELGKIYEDS